MFAVIKTIYHIINNPLSKLFFKVFVKVYLTISKWVFTLIIGPLCFYSSKLVFKFALKKVLPGIIKTYFTKRLPKIVLKLLKHTFPINLIAEVFE